MKSILEGRPALKQEVDKVAEVAGYLWQNGWAERNGGNITINITELVDDDIRKMSPIGPVTPICAEVISIVKGPTSACATWLASRWRTVPSSAFWTIAPAMRS